MSKYFQSFYLAILDAIQFAVLSRKINSSSFEQYPDEFPKLAISFQ